MGSIPDRRERPQCQPAAIASLCKSCKASIIFYDSSYESLASSAASQPGSHTVAQPLSWRVRSEDIMSIVRTAETDVEPVFLREPSEHDVAYIHHSSGTSTGVPKPIPQTHRAGFCVLPRLDGRQAATFTITPLYHGGVADCFRSWTSDALVWLFPGADVPITPKNILSCLSTASSAEHDTKTPPIKYFSSVPYVLQTLADEPSGLSALQAMDLVGVGGAALSPNVGNHLVDRGVNLVSRFGSAECGFLLSSHRDYARDKDWQYLRVPSSCNSLHFEEVDAEAGLSELVVKKGWPHMAKVNRADGNYATSDIFERHPNIPNAWRYHSRSDSQITLLTGKKFDPAPLEDTICSGSGLVKDVMILGNDRQYPGALIFVTDDINGQTEEEIWQLVSKVNASVEAHCRIDKNMLMLISADGTELEKSSKGTILRGATEKRFSEQIEGLYRRQNITSSSSRTPITDHEVKSLVKAIAKDVLGSDLEDEEDFYQHGVDSTKSTQIKSRLQAVSSRM